MYQYSNEGYRDYAPRRQDNPNVYREPHAGANKEDRSMEDAEDYYPTRDTDHYPQNFQNHQLNQRDPGVEAETGYHGRYPEYHEGQNSDETEEVTDLEEDNIPQRDADPSRKIPPKSAPKPRAYFQAQINGANRNRIFSRQESSEYPYTVDALDHMRAGQDLSPTVSRPPPPSSYIYNPPRERMKSNQSNYDSNKSGQSSGDVFDRSQSAFSNSSRADLDRSTLDRSTLSARETPDQNKSLYSTKSPTGSILVNRDAVANSANGTLNQSSLSTRSTTPGRDTRNMIVSPSHGVYRVASRNDVIPSRGLYGVANRSILSNQSVHSGVLSEQNKSVLSQNYSIGQAKTPTYMQNGAAHPVKETPLDATIRSNVNLSRAPSFTLSKSNLFNQSKVVSAIEGSEETYGVRDSLVSLGLICLISLVLIVLGTQLLFRLNGKQFLDVQETIGATNALLNRQSYESMSEIAVAVCSFMVMLDVCCLMVCVIQGYFAVKLLRCSEGQERCYKYLKGCAGTRFIAVTGFFISIPAFLLALLLYMVMEFRATPAIISTVIMTIGLIFIISTVIHSTFYWRQEKSKADQDVPAYEGKRWLNGESVISQSELSTLV